MKTINPNILEEGNRMEVIKESPDEMETIVRCNNCGNETKYGNTRMCSSFVGCDNPITIDGVIYGSCYFDDLAPRVRKCEHRATLKAYRWRDKLKTKVGE